MFFTFYVENAMLISHFHRQKNHQAITPDGFNFIFSNLIYFSEENQESLKIVIQYYF